MHPNETPIVIYGTSKTINNLTRFTSNLPRDNGKINYEATGIHPNGENIIKISISPDLSSQIGKIKQDLNKRIDFSQSAIIEQNKKLATNKPQNFDD